MKFKALSLLLIYLAIVQVTQAQTKTYFIKYKDSISKSEINDKINRKEVLSPNKNATLKIENLSVDYLAKGIAKELDELSRIVKVTFTSEQQAENFLSSATVDPSIEYIQKGNVYKIDYTPNDSLVSEQWALNKIQAFDAWDITHGADTVIIGIIDTGIDYDHFDLRSKIF